MRWPRLTPEGKPFLAGMVFATGIRLVVDAFENEPSAFALGAGVILIAISYLVWQGKVMTR